MCVGVGDHDGWGEEEGVGEGGGRVRGERERMRKRRRAEVKRKGEVCKGNVEERWEEGDRRGGQGKIKEGNEEGKEEERRRKGKKVRKWRTKAGELYLEIRQPIIRSGTG